MQFGGGIKLRTLCRFTSRSVRSLSCHDTEEDAPVNNKLNLNANSKWSIADDVLRGVSLSITVADRPGTVLEDRTRIVESDRLEVEMKSLLEGAGVDQAVGAQ